MAKLTEIRWHARAGQGAVTAAKLVAETALSQGRYMQAMPEYGPERTGAPMKAFTRVCDEPIEVHNNITNPQIVVVLDDTLLDLEDVTAGIEKDGYVVLNTTMTPAAAREKLGVADDIVVATVDATGIAMQTIKRNIPNTPMVAAVSKVTGVVPLDSFTEHLKSTFGAKFTQEVIDANLKSVERAYEEVQTA
jgi:pyruvate ferredoxin oxidoreductase gamma subunit